MTTKRENHANKSVKQALVAALVELTSERPLSSVSVTDLCTRAGVSRMAYYRNYACKEDILSEHLAELVAQYEVLAGPAIRRGEPCTSVACLEACFQLFYDNRDFVQSLYSCGMGQVLSAAIAKVVTKVWGDGSRESEFSSWAQCGAICGVFQPWAQGSFEETPRQVAEKLNRYFSDGVRIVED